MAVRDRQPRHILASWASRAPRAGLSVLHAIRVAAGDCDAWLVELDASSVGLARCNGHARWLTPSDHVRLKRIRDRDERTRRATTYVALRMIVATYVGMRHAKARMLRPRGKAPRLAGVPAIFNLSHCENWALIGLARRGRIGVDLELLRVLPMAAKHRAQIVSAADVISAERPLHAEPDADVIQGWTRLEAFSKATGRGINRTLADFGIRKQQNPRWHTPGASIEEKAQRQLPGYVVRDLRLPAGTIAAVTRTLSCA